MSDEITPEEEADLDIFDDTDETTPTEGNEDDKDTGVSDKDTKVSDEAFLKRVNEIEGRNYKTIEAYQKTVKERNKDFATKPKETPKEEAPQSSVLKGLYFKVNPEAEKIWDKVEADAKELGKDPFVLYESTDFYKGEAKAKLVAEENSKKTNTSQNIKPSEKEVVIETEEDLANASEKERMDFFDKQLKKEGGVE